MKKIIGLPLDFLYFLPDVQILHDFMQRFAVKLSEHSADDSPAGILKQKSGLSSVQFTESTNNT